MCKSLAGAVATESPPSRFGCCLQSTKVYYIYVRCKHKTNIF